MHHPPADSRCPPASRASRVSLKKLAAQRVGFAALVLIGCRTVPAIPPSNLSEPGWAVQHGQVVWRPSRDSGEIAGELVFAIHRDDRTFLEFTKSPIPFVIARTTPEAWHVEFTAGNRSYSGRGDPPARLGWLQLARCLAGKDPARGWSFQKPTNGNWRLLSAGSGEHFEGYLAQ
jgi:hypothetical protein